MSLFAQYHRRALEADGYTVFAPNENPLVNLPSAVAFVRAAGHVVIRAHVPPTPRVGECWVPTRKSSVLNCVHPRWVRSVGSDMMSYGEYSCSLPILIKLSTWHRWVRKTRAVVG